MLAAGYSVLQALLVLAVLIVFARRARAVLFAAYLDRAPFVTALREALRSGHVELALAIAQGCLPAWPARIALRGLSARAQGRAATAAAIEEERLDLDYAVTAGIGTLRSLARMAAPVAFVGIIIELGRAAAGGEGILALQRGLPERLALEHALLSFALGISGTLLGATAVGVLRRAAARITRAADEVAALVQLDAGDAGERRSM